MNKQLTRLYLIFYSIALFLVFHSVAYSLSDREVIGKWIDDTPNIGSTIEIYKQNGKFYIFSSFNDGSTSTQELTKAKSSAGKATFHEINSTQGDHCVITKDNSLELRDKQGWIFTARPINTMKQTARPINTLNPSIGKAEGFRGIAWGTNIKTLKDMVFEFKYKNSDGIRRSYKQENDRRIIGEAKNLSISYSFWQNKFFKVQIMAKDRFNWRKLQRVIFAKYGDPKKENSRSMSRQYPCVKYSWISGKTKIEMHYCPSRRNFETHGFVTLSSVEVEKQQAAFMKQEKALKKQREDKQEYKIKKRAKEAAESDL